MPPRNPKKTPSKPVPSDTERMQVLIGKLLTRLEEVMERKLPSTDAEVKKLQQHCELIFGGKNSLVSALVTLAELKLKLESPVSPEMGAQLPADDPLRMSPADHALVEDFLQQARTSR